jgi:hypothetical protein
MSGGPANADVARPNTTSMTAANRSEKRVDGFMVLQSPCEWFNLSGHARREKDANR